MQREETLAILAAHKDEIRSHGVKSLGLFGSVARNEARSDSDIDLLVEFDRPVDLFALAALQERLEEILGARVDLVLRRALREEFREYVLRDVIDAA